MNSFVDDVHYKQQKTKAFQQKNLHPHSKVQVPFLEHLTKVASKEVL